MSDWSGYGNEGRDGTNMIDDSQHRVGIRERAMDSMDDVRQRAGKVGSRARGGVEHFFQDHPIISGVGVLALGMAIGMLLPQTRPEERLMGDASHRLRERTRDTASKLGDVARTTFEEARDTAMEELEGKGLDPGHLKESVRDAAQGVREAAEKAANEAKETAKEEAKRKDLR